LPAVDRLHDHDAVVVTLPRGHYMVPTSFTARILAVDGMTVALEVDNKAETARLPDQVPNAFLTFRHSDSLVGFRGTLHAARPVGDFRFVVADRAATRSRSTRINCMTWVMVRRLSGDEPGDEVQGTTVNIAPAGLLIEAAGTDAVTGDLVEFHLTHPDDHDKIVSGEATVVRHGEGLVAVAVTDDSAEARAVLGALVVARSRAVLHRNDPVGPEAPGF
jgi:PilZ domain-containing protein